MGLGLKGHWCMSMYFLQQRHLASNDIQCRLYNRWFQKQTWEIIDHYTRIVLFWKTACLMLVSVFALAQNNHCHPKSSTGHEPPCSWNEQTKLKVGQQLWRYDMLWPLDTCVFGNDLRLNANRSELRLKEALRHGGEQAPAAGFNRPWQFCSCRANTIRMVSS